MLVLRLCGFSIFTDTSAELNDDLEDPIQSE